MAGALIALPLGALAATASATTTDAVPLTQATADISAHPHGGTHWLPGGQGHDGPRIQYREGPGHRDGPRIHQDDPGARFFHQGRPSTGSAGSS